MKIFLISKLKLCCGYSLEATWQGDASNEYPQYKFFTEELEKIIQNYCQVFLLNKSSAIPLGQQVNVLYSGLYMCELLVQKTISSLSNQCEESTWPNDKVHGVCYYF